MRGYHYQEGCCCSPKLLLYFVGCPRRAQKIPRNGRFRSPLSDIYAVVSSFMKIWLTLDLHLLQECTTECILCIVCSSYKWEVPSWLGN